MAFQRKKPAAIGTKANYPGFIEPELATSSEKCRAVIVALDGKKFDGIYLGRRKGRDLIYAGKVDHGFDAKSAKDLQGKLKPLICGPQSFRCCRRLRIQKRAGQIPAQPVRCNTTSSGWHT